MFEIWHNPRCSKSRQTLSLLEEAGVDCNIYLYLEDPPDRAKLTRAIKSLDITARDLLRKGEQLYKELGLVDSSLSDKQLVEAMCKYPKLIERPIVQKGERAVLGRPPENVKALLA